LLIEFLLNYLKREEDRLRVFRSNDRFHLEYQWYHRMPWTTLTSITKFITKTWEDSESTRYFEITNDIIFKNKENRVNKAAISRWKERSQRVNGINEREDKTIYWGALGFEYFIIWTSSKQGKEWKNKIKIIERYSF